MVIHSKHRWPLLLLSNICLLAQKCGRWQPQKIDPHKSSPCVDFAGSHCAFVASLDTPTSSYKPKTCVYVF